MEDECLYFLPRDSEGLGDLLMAQGVEFGQNECSSLLAGQAAHVDDEVPQVLAPLNLTREAVCDRLVEVGRGPLTLRSQDRVAPVAGDREQPGSEVDRLLRGDEVAVRGQEGVLNGVLGLLGVAEHVASEGENPAMVAVVHGLECRRTALPDQRHQTRIGNQSQQVRGGKGRRPCRCLPRHRARFHGRIICGR